MVLRIGLNFCLYVGVEAAHWAVLAAGSKTYDNYRHQADLCRAYHLLKANGFPDDKIITMAFDDVAHAEENPFPGQLFNEPDGEDVYAGCKLDYTGDDVTASNFAGILLGNGTTGGNGRMLNSTVDDNVLIFYVDHGAPGLIEFPNADVMHKTEFNSVLVQMHEQKMFKNMLIYIEACESGSMLEDLPTDLGIYGVTAVDGTVPSLGTYCGFDAVVNGTKLNTCLGDLFAVMWMQFIEQDDGSSTLQQFFETVYDNVASYAALHYGKELNQQYGDLSLTKLKTSDFFWPSDSTGAKNLAKRPAWKTPSGAFSTPRLDMDRLTFIYSEVSAMPTYRGKHHWGKMKAESKRLKSLVGQQEETQQVYWSLIEDAIPESDSEDMEQERVWTQKLKSSNAQCEISGHKALVAACKGKVDMISSYALQFHQVLVNLCARKELGWARDPSKAEAAAIKACAASEAEQVLI